MEDDRQNLTGDESAERAGRPATTWWRPLVPHALALTLYTALGALAVLPIPGPGIPRTVAGFRSPDTFLHLWNPWRAAQDLLGRDLGYGTSHLLMYPTVTPDVQAVFDPLHPLLGAPFVILWNSPPLAADASLAIGLILTAFAGYLFLIDYVERRRYALLGGAMFSLNPFVWEHSSLGFTEYACWGLIPLALWAYRRAVRRPSLPRVAAYCVAVLTCFLMSIYCAWCLCGVMAFLSLPVVFPQLRRGSRECTPRLSTLVRVQGAALLSLLPLFCVWLWYLWGLEFRGIPLLRPFPFPPQEYVSQIRGGYADYILTLEYSLDLSVWLAPGRDVWAHCGALWAWLPLIGLASAGWLLRDRRTNTLLWGLLGAVFFVLALGPFVILDGHVVSDVHLPYAWLYRWLPGFSRMAFPIRLLMPAILAILVLATCGMESVDGWVAARFGLQARRVVSLVAAASCFGAFLLFSPFQLPYPRAPIPIPDLYETIAAEPGEFAVLELPYSPHRGDLIERHYWQTVHGKPIFAGQQPMKYVWPRPDARLRHNSLVRLAQADVVEPTFFNSPTASTDDCALAKLGFRFLVLHADGYSRPSVYTRIVDITSFVVGPPFYSDEHISGWRLCSAGAAAAIAPPPSPPRSE